MINNILIFRTDRIGDLIVSCPAIVTIKNYIKDSNIVLITSRKNYEYAKRLNLFNEIYIFPDKNIISKIFFIINLIKRKFKYVFVFDGKERSIITCFLVRSKNKIALTPKINFLYKILNIKFFLDDEKTNLDEIFQNFLDYCQINTKISNYDFLKNKSNNNFSNQIEIKDYLHIHLDEKWFSEMYIKKYTDINPDYSAFIEFLNKIAERNHILITTGLIDFALIDKLKNEFFDKINTKIFIKKIKNYSINLIYKPTFEDIESLLRNSNTLIACHGAITHAANSFNVKKIDILEKSRADFYKRFTSYLNNYHSVYRSNFNILKNEISKKILN
tara:strand:+ start:2468 stop:3460 length:993 start_codon:yes stop_codon:yes gene_type:complete